MLSVDQLSPWPQTCVVRGRRKSVGRLDPSVARRMPADSGQPWIVPTDKIERNRRREMFRDECGLGWTSLAVIRPTAGTDRAAKDNP